MAVSISASLLTVFAVYAVSSAYLLAVAAVAARKPDPGEAPDGLFFVLVVPALNEELVIGNTVRHLLSLKGDNYLILVIDDGSNDRTAHVVDAFPPEKVRVVSRKAPFARQGKGEALNHAYRVVLTSELPEIYGAANIIFSVMDADGQVPEDMLHAVTPYFGEGRTAAVQVGVRMLNARENLLTRWQQHEFVTFNWIFSRARENIGSVGLGGNGQFVRMSALASLGEGPWTDCLTEDLDIGLRLMLGGWHNRYCHDTQVYQQAVPSLRRLVRQRSRWYQGHLTCWRHIPRIVASDWPAPRKADVLNYLLSPGLVLPMGLFSLAMVALAFVPGHNTFGSGTGFSSPSAIATWYILSMGAAPLFGVALWRSKECSLLAAMFWAHIFLLGSYIWLFAGVIAIKRMVTGKAGWLKTARARIGPPDVGPSRTSEENPSRFAAAALARGFNEDSGHLLGLRPVNFVPRAGRETSAVAYLGSSGAERDLSARLLLARGDARLVRLEQLLSAAEYRSLSATAEV